MTDEQVERFCEAYWSRWKTETPKAKNDLRTAARRGLEAALGPAEPVAGWKEDEAHKLLCIARDGLNEIATSWFKDDQYQDFAKHILEAIAEKIAEVDRLAASPQPKESDSK